MFVHWLNLYTDFIQFYGLSNIYVAVRCNMITAYPNHPGARRQIVVRHKLREYRQYDYKYLRGIWQKDRNLSWLSIVSLFFFCNGFYPLSIRWTISRSDIGKQIFYLNRKEKKTGIMEFAASNHWRWSARFVYAVCLFVDINFTGKCLRICVLSYF